MLKNMNKNILYVSILITGFLVVGAIANRVDALEVSYPITELGNCADQASCKAYCDKSANMDACLGFAEKNNLMSKEEIKVAKNFKNTGMTGPGGCKGKDECSTYCNGPDHMDECITFAEKNGMMSGSQLEEAKKVQGAISRGIKPPACGGKDACNSYCSSKEHMEECVSFAQAAGMISKEEADKIKKGGSGEKGGDKQGPEGQDDRQGPGGQSGPEGGNGQGGDRQGPGGKGKGQGGSGGGGNGGGGKSNGGPGGQGGGQQGQGGDRQGPGGGGGNGGGNSGSGGGNGGGGAGSGGSGGGGGSGGR